MNRLTYKVNGHYYFDNLDDLIDASNKLGQLEDIEEELGIDLILLFKALKDGLFYKLDSEKYIYRWNVGIIPEARIIVDYKNKHLMLISEPTIYSGDDWSLREYLYFSDYGKTWALKKEELE